MRENRTSGSEGGEAQINELSLPLSFHMRLSTVNSLACHQGVVGGKLESMSQRTALRLSTILILIGGLLSGYLLYRHLGLLGAWEVGQDACSTLLGTGCDATLHSQGSIRMGIPLAGWGLVYFCFLLTLVWLTSLLGEDFQRQGMIAAIAVTGVGAVASACLLTGLLLGTWPFCPACALINALNLALLGGLKIASGLSWSGAVRGVGQAFRFLRSSGEDQSRLSSWRLVALLLPLLVGIVVYQWVLVEFVRFEARAPRVSGSELLTAYQSNPLQALAIRPDHPALGPPDAPLQMVIFSDFQCPYCKEFAVKARQLEEHYSKQLRLVFVHFPLGKACNPIMRKELHAWACEAARASEAARLQGEFWSFHDAVFGQDLGTDSKVFHKLAAATGLDTDRFARDLSSEAVAGRVAADIQMGIDLDINSTPSVFLNNRRVPDVRAAPLEALIEELLGN